MIIDIVEIGKMEIVSSTPICPSCRQIGQKVNQKTVSSLLNKKKSSLVTNKEYYICLSRDCPIAYYTQEGDFFNKDDISVVIWFKEKSPVPICYCKNVTDEDILDHIVNKQCCKNIEDIQLHLGANTGKECLTKNPTGK
jgi:5-methylcytosine-specific restriction endonuclease McrA